MCTDTRNLILQIIWIRNGILQVVTLSNVVDIGDPQVESNAAVPGILAKSQIGAKVVNVILTAVPGITVGGKGGSVKPTGFKAQLRGSLASLTQFLGQGASTSVRPLRITRLLQFFSVVACSG